MKRKIIKTRYFIVRGHEGKAGYTLLSSNDRNYQRESFQKIYNDKVYEVVCDGDMAIVMEKAKGFGCARIMILGEGMLGTKAKFCYKVVRRVRNDFDCKGWLISFNGYVGLSGNNTLIYEKNVWTKPIIEGSRLFVFKSFYEARLMLGEFPCEGSEIWRAEYDGDIIKQHPAEDFIDWAHGYANDLSWKEYTAKNPLNAKFMSYTVPTLKLLNKIV